MREDFLQCLALYEKYHKRKLTDKETSRFFLHWLRSRLGLKRIENVPIILLNKDRNTKHNNLDFTNI